MATDIPTSNMTPVFSIGLMRVVKSLSVEKNSKPNLEPLLNST